MASNQTARSIIRPLRPKMPLEDLSLTEVFDDLPKISVVDIGASALDGQPPWQRLLDVGKANVVGFEPDAMQFELLQKQSETFSTCLPYAVGDGKPGMLNVCFAPGMTSLLEPDFEVLDHFHGFTEWGKVLRREPVATRRLDDIQEVTDIDFLKLDVQGSELAVLQGAPEKLKRTLFVQTEVQFVPFYKQQPLFAELDQHLREAGFWLHRFQPMISRVFKPMLVNNSIYSGLSQVLWTDAVYVKRFTDFAELDSGSLLRIAFIAHELYRSFDLTILALDHIDRRDGSQRGDRYRRFFVK